MPDYFKPKLWKNIFQSTIISLCKVLTSLSLLSDARQRRKRLTFTWYQSWHDNGNTQQHSTTTTAAATSLLRSHYEQNSSRAVAVGMVVVVVTIQSRIITKVEINPLNIPVTYVLAYSHIGHGSKVLPISGTNAGCSCSTRIMSWSQEIVPCAREDVQSLAQT